MIRLLRSCRGGLAWKPPENYQCTHRRATEDFSYAEDRSVTLHVVFDKVLVLVWGLEALNVVSNQYGSLLIPVIMAKFSTDISLRIATETGREFGKLITCSRYWNKRLKEGKPVKGQQLILTRFQFRLLGILPSTLLLVHWSLTTISHNVSSVTVNTILPPVQS